MAGPTVTGQNASERPQLDGDDAKRSVREDAFGLTQSVQALTEILRSRVSAGGYAIGIEGKWGSGKTTLLNFIEEALRDGNDSTKKVIRFDPWLIGSKQSLLTAFFEDLRMRIEEFRDFSVLRNKIGDGRESPIDRLSRHICQYSKYVELVAKTASGAVALTPSLSAKVAALGISTFSQILSFFGWRALTLDALKTAIIGDLNAVAKLLPEARIIVLIDDTDRLDPAEAVEILRLIKAVANFPLITYLVCFDRTVLSAQVFEVIRVGTGSDYLEKIFQQILPLPPQEPFALRRFVRKSLTELFPSEMAATAPREMEVAERQDAIFDRWVGKLVTTPRDAIRLCESVKLGWPYLSGRGDFLDYVWLQLIKLQCHELFEWTRRYVTNLGSYRDGGRPGDNEPTNEAANLKTILGKLDWGQAPDRSGITSILPGLKSVLLEGTKSTVFDFSPKRELADYESQRRLGSPSHWRLYFAFDMPSYALDDSEIANLRKLAAHGQRLDAAALLRKLAQRPAQIAGYYLDVMLDRMIDQVDKLTVEEQIGLAWAFVEIMDDLPRGGRMQFSDIDPWRKSLRLLGQAVGPVFSEMIANGRSINWIAYAMRDQGFALGVADENRKAPERQWMTRTDFDSALRIAIQRFRELGLDGISKLPEPLQVLFCWVQLGNEAAELQNLIAAQTKDNAMFVLVLGAMRSWVSSSDKGIYSPLDPDIVSHFMDVRVVNARLRELAAQNDAPELKRAADDLLKVWPDKIRGVTDSTGKQIPS
ncbi:MAG TPA: P-loop NTPase fold protein [Rhizomicrobium sp.]|nr:P-loop NTPase fold protein [Rhizomicrobium sp.]